MNEMNIADFIRTRLAEARAKGIPTPVILTLSEHSDHARAIYEELRGHPMAPPSSEEGDEFGPWEVLAPEEASGLLRHHGEKGGAHAADLLCDPAWREAVQPDFWFVGLLKDNIFIRAFLDGDEVWHTVTGYGHVPRSCQTPSELAQDSGPSLWKLSLDGGKVIPVCGPNGSDVVMASALAGIAADRVIEIKHKGKQVQIEVDGDMLASLLLDVYGEMPHVIAETIMALKKAGNGKESWLTEILHGRPELQDLAKKVHHELTGE
jgi:hypothetical protein